MLCIDCRTENGLEEDVLGVCDYMQRLVDEKSINHVLVSTVSVMPPDIVQGIERRWKEQGHPGGDSR